ncbi:MAG: serine/threonine protein kinase, partial [Lentisphaeraceae bacterium]|nr:serine/threonine protein kinase [Lentisphaeraceae bacterium]
SGNYRWLRSKSVAQPITEIFLKICDAVAYAHAEGVVHLDLKPANIQIDEYGQVLVCDWGLARRLESDQQELGLDDDDVFEGHSQVKNTLDGRIKGSPGYMAPEQVNNEFGSRSVRTDIYSLGAMLYAMLTGQSPVESDDLQEIIDKTLKGEIIPPVQLKPELVIPNSLNAVCLKALSLQPQQRYSSVAQLSDEIRAYTAGFVTKAEDAGMWILVKKYIQRHRTVSLVSLASLLIIGALLLFFVISLNTEKNIAQVAREQAEISNKKALTLVDELNVEKVERRKASKSAAAEYYKTAQIKYRWDKYESALQAIKHVVALDPDFKEAWDLLARLYFGKLDFQKVIDSSNNGSMGKEDKWLREQAQLSLRITKGELPAADYIYNLRHRLIDSELNILYLHRQMFRTMTRLYPLEDRWEFARRSYQFYHSQGVRKRPFVFDKKKVGDLFSLSLTGNKGNLLTIVLRGLPLVELDLSNTSTRALKDLVGMPLKRLDISATWVKNISYLAKMPIEELNLANTRVVDLLPLKNTPLRKLVLGGEAISLVPLKSCKKLEKLIIPRDVYSETLLKKYGLWDKVEYR